MGFKGLGGVECTGRSLVNSKGTCTGYCLGSFKSYLYCFGGSLLQV